MKLLEEKILAEGRILSKDVLKVDSFLNHKLDIPFLSELGAEWKRIFADADVTKILTVEASGIALASLTAAQFGVPAVYAKKLRLYTAGADFYKSKIVSFTHGQAYDLAVYKPYITADDRILIIDDFLANGSALRALIDIVEAAGATLIGAGIAIEKAYMNAGEQLRARGYRIESLAKICSMSEKDGIKFL